MKHQQTYSAICNDIFFFPDLLKPNKEFQIVTDMFATES